MEEDSPSGLIVVQELYGQVVEIPEHHTKDKPQSGTGEECTDGEAPRDGGDHPQHEEYKEEECVAGWEYVAHLLGGVAGGVGSRSDEELEGVGVGVEGEGFGLGVE